MRKTKHYFGRNHVRQNPQKKTYKAIYPPALFYWYKKYNLAIVNYNRLIALARPLGKLGQERYDVVKEHLEQAFENKTLVDLKRASKLYYEFMWDLSDGPVVDEQWWTHEDTQGDKDA